jgi:hypothetical protein
VALLRPSLRNEQPIERVAVMQRKVGHRQAVVGLQPKQPRSAGQHLIAQIARHREPADGDLDSDLAEGDHAEPQPGRPGTSLAKVS